MPLLLVLDVSTMVGLVELLFDTLRLVPFMLKHNYNLYTDLPNVEKNFSLNGLLFNN